MLASDAVQGHRLTFVLPCWRDGDLETLQGSPDL